MPTEECRDKEAPEPVAVIGMGCRFSGEASGVNEFWEMISSGRSGHCKVPGNRYDSSAWYHPSHDRKGAINHDSGFFLKEDPSLFDAPFFSITAKEAAGMDPAQRLLLEVAYEAFENGGIPIESLPQSNTAVFSGCMTNDYELLSTRDIHDMPHNSATGNGRTMLANRLSWFFDLRGPSVMMDTACSSSLTALHLATQAIRSGECGMALVTGASLILDPNFTQRLSYMHMLSPDGISHSFDSKANGYGRGEGLGAVLLKHLSAAVADGDAIRAIIRETGINQDGRTPGITMPSADAQADLIHSVYAKGRLSMRETTLFEAHGTGTGIGDPTELSAIGKTMGASRQPDDEPIFVGSVKGNLGHTEGAAGVASLIKTVLCLENATFVPNAGFAQLNPKIRLDEWRLQLTNEITPWPAHLPQRASINSFGFGGSNAHAVLESASEYFGTSSALTISSENRSPRLIVFSSHDKAGIDRISKTWSTFIEKEIKQGSHVSLKDAAYTMSTRRSQLPFRSFAVAGSSETLQATLEQGLPSFPRATRAGQSNLAFIFTGQGAQWAEMGKSLLDFPVYADSMARSQKILSALDCPWNIEEEIRADASSSLINQPDRSQPISCALQIALVELLANWGVRPNATVGHSSGEIGAAYAAGLLTHKDAIRIAYFRGVLSRRLVEDGKRGSMMAVALSTTDIQKYLDNLPDQSVVIACENSPSSITMSGDEDRISELEETLKRDGHFARKLRVNTAYHSPHMQVLAKEYHDSIASIAPENRHHDTIAMFSSVKKERVYAKDLSASYWVQNMVGRVEFASAVSQVLTHTQAAKGRRKPVPVKWNGFLEIGPHDALKGPFNQTLQSVNANLSSLPYLSLVQRGKDAQQTSLQAAGTLWSIGASIDVGSVNRSFGPEDVPKLVTNLPSYSWNHQSSFWHESICSSDNRLRKDSRHDILGVSMAYQNTFESRWRNFLRVSEIPWLADHVVAGSIIFPAAGTVGMVAEAAQRLSDPKKSLAGIELHDVEFLRGVVVPPDEQGLETILSVRPHHDIAGWYVFGLFSVSEGTSWVQHAKGGFAMHYEDGKGHVDSSNWESIVQDIRQTQDVASKADIEKVYNWLGDTGGVTLGPSFRSIVGAFFCHGEGRMWISGVINNTEREMPHERESRYFMHPTSLDALFQAAVLSRSEELTNQNANIPVAVERLYLPTNLSFRPGDTFAVHTKTYEEEGESYSDCVASDSAWSQPQVMLQGVRLGRVPVRKAGLGEEDALQSRFSSLVWKGHAELSTGLQSFHGHGHTLGYWIDLLCHTYGDTHALLIIPHGKTEDMIKAIESLAPRSQARPHIAYPTVLIYGPNQLGEKETASFQKLMPHATIIFVDKITEMHSSTLPDAAFDVVVFREPILLDAEGPLSALSILDKITKPDGWMVLANPESSLNQVVDHPSLNGWKVKDSSSVDNFVLLRRELSKENLDATIYVLVVDRSHIADHLLSSLAHVFAAVGSEIHLVEVGDIPTLAGKTVVSLLEIQRPWVSQWTETEFEQFKVLLQAKYVLWVSQIVEKGTADHAEFGATTGLLRTLRNEQRGATLPHVQFDATGGMNSTGLAQGLLEIIQLTLRSTERLNLDMEFRLRDGEVLVPRLIADQHVDEAMQSMIHGPRAKLSNLSDDPRPLTLQNYLLDAETLRWERNLDFENQLLPDHVEVQVKFQTISVPSQSGIHAPETRISVLEATGTVLHVGLKAGEKFAPGDLVTLFYRGGNSEVANRVRVPIDAVSKIQPDSDLIKAASMPVAYTLAYMTLFKTASLTEGSSVLVVGSVNQTIRAIIECGLASGIVVYVAVDNTDFIDSLAMEYPELSNKVFFLHSGLVSQVLRLTGGRGVSATVSSLSGSATRIAAQCLVPGGYYVDLTGDINPATLPKKFFSRGCSLTSMQLQRALKFQQDEVLASFRDVSTLLRSHHGVRPYKTFAVCDLEDGLRHARNTGSRVVLSLEAPGTVPIYQPLSPPVTLGSQNTYVLAGGLGTVGLALSESLISLGAKSIVFLGRSSQAGEAQQASLQHFNELGCETHVRRCDITRVDDIWSFISEAREKNWQIKGIIQCTTVLKDSMFANMTFEQWKLSTESKILGTFNLHHLFPSTLDFFITLSSVASVIGNMGQSNYSAGNAVMDDLMSWRRNHHLCGQSINIGLVPDASGVGDVNESAEERRKRYNHLEGTEITIKELQSLLHVLLQNPSSVPPQLVAGITDSLPRQSAASWQLDRKFDHRIQITKEEDSAVPDLTSSLLKTSTTVEEAAGIVTRALQVYLGKSMAAESDSIDTELPMPALGVDSLRASEVQNWVSRETGAELSSFDFLGPQPLRVLAEKIAMQSPYVVVV